MSVIGSREAMPLPRQGHCPNRECSWHSGPAKALGRPLEGVWSPVEAVASGRAKGSSLDYLEKVPGGTCNQLGFQPPPRSHQFSVEGDSSRSEEERVSGLLGSGLHPCPHSSPSGCRIAKATLPCSGV